MFAEVAAVRDFAAADHALTRQAFALTKLERFAEAGAIYARLASDFADSMYAAEATISAGRCYYRADEPAKAATWLRKALERGDAHASEAAHWLARLLIREGKAGEAVELVERQLAAGGEGPFVANLQVDRADALYEIPNRRRDALDLYVRFAETHPRHELAPQALYNAAFTALELKQYNEGRDHAEAFLAAWPQDSLAADAKYVAAECNLQLKKYDEAARQYRDLAENHAAHPDHESFQVRRGLVAYLQKDYPAVVATLGPVAETLRSPPARAEAQFLVGASQFFSDKFAEAAAALTRSLDASPDWRQADETLLLLARAQARLDKPGRSPQQSREAAGRLSGKFAARSGTLSAGGTALRGFGLCRRGQELCDRGSRVP
jgi:cellulose synthase operon protein C